MPRQTNNNRVEVTVATLQEKVQHLETDLHRVDETSVKQEEFRPVKMVVYGLVGMILTGVVTALIALVINSKK